MSDRQIPDGQHEDDLLADFRDVPGDDDGGKGAATGDGATDLDALDAFLNEFGQGDAVPEPREDSATFDEPDDVVTESIDLATDELEPVAVDGMPDIEPDLTVPEDAVDVPELHVEAEAVPDDMNLDMLGDMPEPVAEDNTRQGIDDMFDLPPASSTAAGVAPSYAAPVSIMAADDGPPADNRMFDVSSIGVAVFSLVIAAVAGWFALSLHGQINDLRAELAQLRQQPAGVLVGPDRSTQETVARLAQRVNEMALVIDGPMTHLSESSQQLDAVIARLDTLEHDIGGLRDALAVTERAAQAAAKVAEKPAATRPAPQPAAKPATTAPAPQAAPKPTGSGGWVVNVASLTDARAAAAEQQRMQQAGFNVEVQTAQMNGRTWHRVRATGFASREQAQVYSDMIRYKMGVTPWVGLDK